MSVETVLLHTNVFTAWLRPRSSLVPMYGKHVFGRRIAIAQQTVAEVRYGAIAAGLGRAAARSRRRRRDLTVLDRRTADWAWMVKVGGFRAQLHTRPAALWSRAGNSLARAFPDAVAAALAAWRPQRRPRLAAPVRAPRAARPQHVGVG